MDLDSAIELAIHARLMAWAPLTALGLAVYRNQPAIFTRWPIPEDAPNEFLVVSPPAADSESSSKTSAGRAIIRDVSAYTLASGNPTRVNALASAVRDALRRWQPNLTGGARVLVAEPRGPIANDGDGTYGRVVTIRFTVHGT